VVNTLYEINDLTLIEVERIVSAFNKNSQLNGCWQLTRGTVFVNFLNKYSSSTLRMKNERLIVDRPSLAEEVPF